MKRLLIINRAQFGYHIDTFKYCKFLNDRFHITYLCFDYGLPKIYNDNIDIIYISRHGNIVFRWMRLIISIFYMKRKNFDILFFVYFVGVSFSRFFYPNNSLILDIRTGSVSSNMLLNSIKNFLIKIECLFFQNISIVSKNLAKSIGLKNFYELPLGGEVFSFNPKDFSNIKLLYVGTLENRNIIECVKGFHQFISKNPECDINFTIIGDGPNNERSELIKFIDDNAINKYVHVLGYIPNEKLHKYFQISNVGISFIPTTKYYQNQPPTKTFEYLLSGLPVIATKTKENLRWLKEEHGFFIEDNADSFKLALDQLYNDLDRFNGIDIRNEYLNCTWKNIVNIQLIPLLEKLLKNK